MKQNKLSLLQIQQKLQPQLLKKHHQIQINRKKLLQLKKQLQQRKKLQLPLKQLQKRQQLMLPTLPRLLSLQQVIMILRLIS